LIVAVGNEGATLINPA